MSLEGFKYVWNESSKKDIQYLMSYFHNFCKERNIPYFIFFGTLLGKIRHKGSIIPWDDDADFCASSKINRFYKYLENDIVGVAKGGKYKKFYKIFLKKNPIIDGNNKNSFCSNKKCLWSWPFLDIFPYKNISSKDIMVIYEDSIEYKYPKKYVFPTKLSFFENDNYTIPAKPEKLLNMIYGKEWNNVCMSGDLRHKTELPIKEYIKPCKKVTIKRPRGRKPKNKIWSSKKGKWVIDKQKKSI
jgi:hypothetical protein